jgi:hypothetical protein
LYFGFSSAKRLRGEKVAAARHGADQSLFSVAQRAAHVVDRLGQRVIGDCKTVPDSRNQFFLGDYAPGILHEAIEKIE